MTALAWKFPNLSGEVKTMREGLRNHYDNPTSPRSWLNPQLPLQPISSGNTLKKKRSQGRGHTRTNAFFMKPAVSASDLQVNAYLKTLDVNDYKLWSIEDLASDLKKRNQKFDAEVQRLQSTAGLQENQQVFNRKKSQTRASRRQQEIKVEAMKQADAYRRTLNANAPLGPHQRDRINFRELGIC